ncbi:hypothetical protein E2C01_076190 [Portunus trituberculatus]|uniref:Uncharacterized protein n=1 Tax=Portunus trituberculatus TaxID=210409 RepID=A0A5B7IH68_PORTR|nr:hypothetical protein [Portunus trituberculatus]
MEEIIKLESLNDLLQRPITMIHTSVAETRQGKGGGETREAAVVVVVEGGKGAGAGQKQGR